MIEKVVARRDLREHLADLARGVDFGLGSFGLRAFYGGGCVSGHRWRGKHKREADSSLRSE